MSGRMRRVNEAVREVVSEGLGELQRLLDDAERYLGGQEWELSRIERRILAVEE